MTWREFLMVMTIGTVGAWLTWFIILWTSDPTETSLIGFLFFYLSLLVALIGTFSIIGSTLRVLVKRPGVISRQVLIAFRHAVWFSFLLVGSLFLVSLDLWHWWSMILFILVLALLEFFFLLARPTRPKIE